jgi:hypothetical protein
VQVHSITAAYHSLLAAIINRAIEDLKENRPRRGKNESDHAMIFIMSGKCEAWCLELDVDYKAVREKAEALYRRITGKEATGPAGEKRSGRPANGLRRVNTRQSPGELNSGTYRYVPGHFREGPGR